jgi:hypothetical protein
MCDLHADAHLLLAASSRRTRCQARPMLLSQASIKTEIELAAAPQVQHTHQQAAHTCVLQAQALECMGWLQQEALEWAAPSCACAAAVLGVQHKAWVV